MTSGGTVNMPDPNTGNVRDQVRMSPLMFRSTFDEEFKKENPATAAMNAYRHKFQPELQTSYHMGEQYGRPLLNGGVNMLSKWFNQGPGMAGGIGALGGGLLGYLGASGLNMVRGDDAINPTYAALLGALGGGLFGGAGGWIKNRANTGTLSQYTPTPSHIGPQDYNDYFRSMGVPVKSGSYSQSQLQAFQKAHGSAFDPKSRMDKQKMLKMNPAPAAPAPAPAAPAPAPTPAPAAPAPTPAPTAPAQAPTPSARPVPPVNSAEWKAAIRAKYQTTPEEIARAKFLQQQSQVPGTTAYAQSQELAGLRNPYALPSAPKQTQRAAPQPQRAIVPAARPAPRPIRKFDDSAYQSSLARYRNSSNPHLRQIGVELQGMTPQQRIQRYKQWDIEDGVKQSSWRDGSSDSFRSTLDEADHILAVIRRSAGLSSLEKAQMMEGVSQLSMADVLNLKQLIGLSSGAAAGAIIARFLLNRGLIGTLVGALAGGALGGSLFGQRSSGSSTFLGQPLSF